MDIEVVDRNDNAPQFLNETFDFDVYEGPESLTDFKLLVHDADFEQNSELSFSKAGLACGMYRLTSTRLSEIGRASCRERV
mgnify:CR=1 FL=1